VGRRGGTALPWGFFPVGEHPLPSVSPGAALGSRGPLWGLFPGRWKLLGSTVVTSIHSTDINRALSPSLAQS
jgi:hypothetical protein